MYNYLHTYSSYPSGKSAVLQASDDHHGINSVLQSGSFLRLTVGVTHLRDENIQQNDNHHRHVGEKDEDRQPPDEKQKKFHCV